MKIHFLLFASALTSFAHYYHCGGRCLFISFFSVLLRCRREYVLLLSLFLCCINAHIKNILSFVDKPGAYMPFDLILSETFQPRHIVTLQEIWARITMTPTSKVTIATRIIASIKHGTNLLCGTLLTIEQWIIQRLHTSYVSAILNAASSLQHRILPFERHDSPKNIKKSNRQWW